MAMTSYMKVIGRNQGEMQGDCPQAGREGLILVYGMDHSVEIPRDTHTGLPTGQRIHKPLVITKAFDKSSPKLMQAVCSGEQVTVQLDFYRITDLGKEELYYTIKLDNAIVVNTRSYKPTTFVEENKPYKDMEDIHFTYESIIWTYVPDGIESQDSWKTPMM